MKGNYQIAIDGPSATGKSTIAKKLASSLNFIYIDTGAMYRSIALYCIENNIDIDNKEVIEPILKNIEIDIKYIDGVQHIYLNNRDVSETIRENKVSQAASKVSVHEPVRKKLVNLQQELASKSNVIMDGRDIGTVVLPNATLKIYLTASSSERAKRRMLELQEKGTMITLEEVLKDLEERDYRDTHREIGPLKKADDAIEVDTTNMNIEEVLNTIRDLFNKKVGIE